MSWHEAMTLDCLNLLRALDLHMEVPSTHLYCIYLMTFLGGGGDVETNVALGPVLELALRD